MLFAITGSPKLSILNYLFRHLNCCSYVKHNEKRAQRFHLTRTNEFFVLHLIFKIWTGWWVRVLPELWAHMQLSGSPQQTNSPEPVWPFWEPLHYVQRRNPHYKTTIPHVWFERAMEYQPFLSQTQLVQVPQLDGWIFPRKNIVQRWSCMKPTQRKKKPQVE